MIALCGFMGCGKTTLAKKMTNYNYCVADSDDLIEQKAHKVIPRIFSEDGEEYFRMLELEVATTANVDILSLGGGAFNNPKTEKAITKRYTVVFIDTPFKFCYERIKSDIHRPLAFNSSESELRKLYDTRRKKYMAVSSFTIDGSLNITQKVDILLDILKNSTK